MDNNCENLTSKNDDLVWNMSSSVDSYRQPSMNNQNYHAYFEHSPQYASQAHASNFDQLHQQLQLHQQQLQQQQMPTFTPSDFHPFASHHRLTSNYNQVSTMPNYYQNYHPSLHQQQQQLQQIQAQQQMHQDLSSASSYQSNCRFQDAPITTTTTTTQNNVYSGGYGQEIDNQENFINDQIQQDSSQDTEEPSNSPSSSSTSSSLLLTALLQKNCKKIPYDPSYKNFKPTIVSPPPPPTPATIENHQPENLALNTPPLTPNSSTSPGHWTTNQMQGNPSSSSSTFLSSIFANHSNLLPFPLSPQTDTQGHLPKKSRQQYNKAQTASLEYEFGVSKYLIRRRRAMIAERLGLSERQVKVWFQNRRQKEKKQKGYLSPEPDSTGLQNFMDQNFVQHHLRIAQSTEEYVERFFPRDRNF